MHCSRTYFLGLTLVIKAELKKLLKITWKCLIKETFQRAVEICTARNSHLLAVDGANEYNCLQERVCAS
jgi:predicted type IV restriction endonuclease